MMKVYLAGPMKGHPYFNFPLFNTAARALRNLGFVVVNPAEHDATTYPDISTWPGYATGDTDACPEFNLADVLRWDFHNLMECDGIVMLPGWENSSGARDERHIAERTGLRIFSAHFDKDERNPILVEEYPRMHGPTVKEVA